MRSKFLQQVDAAVSVAAQTITLTSGAATIKGAAVAHVGDNGTLGVIRSALVHIQAGVSGAANLTLTPKIQQSDTTTDGDFTDVTLKAGQTLPTVTVTTTATGTLKFFVKLSGLKKYVRVVLTAAGTGTDTCLVAGSIILGDGSVESLPRAAVPTVYEPAA